MWFHLKIYDLSDIAEAGGILLRTAGWMEEENAFRAKEMIQEKLRDLGLSIDTLVILYGDADDDDEVKKIVFAPENMEELVAILTCDPWEGKLMALRAFSSRSSKSTLEELANELECRLPTSIKKKMIFSEGGFRIVVGSPTFDELYREQIKDQLKDAII